MRMYVGARLAEVDRVRQVNAVGRELGFSVFDWTEGGSKRGDHAAMQTLSASMIRECASAKVAVFLLMNGEQSPQRGLHVELGAALAGGADVLVWVPEEHGEVVDPSNPRCISFYTHPRVTCVVGEVEGLLDDVRAFLEWYA